MDAPRFLGLEPTDDPRRWRMPVVPELATGGGFLFGGCGLAAAIAALEATTDRPLVWATAQYLSHARPPEVLDLEVILAVEGRRTTQARVVARTGNLEVLTVNAALGRRPLEATGSWAVRPDVPGPDDSPDRLLRPSHEGTIMSRIDMRLAQGRQHDELDGRPGDGRSAMWAHLPDLECSPAALAVLGDWVPFGIGQALGLRAGGSSLDNTLRVVRIVPTTWVLLDVRVHAVADGVGHGLVHLWAEDGTLLGTASQSATVRFWRDQPG